MLNKKPDKPKTIIEEIIIINFPTKEDKNSSRELFVCVDMYESVLSKQEELRLFLEAGEDLINGKYILADIKMNRNCMCKEPMM